MQTFLVSAVEFHPRLYDIPPDPEYPDWAVRDDLCVCYRDVPHARHLHTPGGCDCPRPWPLGIWWDPSHTIVVEIHKSECQRAGLRALRFEPNASNNTIGPLRLFNPVFERVDVVDSIPRGTYDALLTGVSFPNCPTTGESSVQWTFLLPHLAMRNGSGLAQVEAVSRSLQKWHHVFEDDDNDVDLIGFVARPCRVVVDWIESETPDNEPRATCCSKPHLRRLPALEHRRFVTPDGPRAIAIVDVLPLESSCFSEPDWAGLSEWNRVIVRYRGAP